MMTLIIPFESCAHDHAIIIQSLKNFRGRYFENVLAARSCLCDVLRPTRNWRDGEKHASHLASFTRSAKFIFFQAIIHFTVFNAIISEFRAGLAENDTAQEQPFSRAVVKRNLSDEMKSRKRILAAEYCSK